MSMIPRAPIPHTRFINRPDGRVAYDVDGDGPLVGLVPGMGDLDLLSFSRSRPAGGGLSGGLHRPPRRRRQRHDVHLYGDERRPVT